MHPLLSWSILLAIFGSVGYYYSKHGKPSRAKGGRTKAVPERRGSDFGGFPEEKKSRKKKTNTTKPKEALAAVTAGASNLSAAVVDTATSLTSGKPRKGGAQQKPSTVAEKENVQATSEDKDDIKAFAQQLAGVRKGTDLKPAAAGSVSKKQRRAKNAATTDSSSNTSAQMSTTSSTTGQDADDDLSPVTSPSFSAATPAGGDISDMLEAPSASRNVLRLTGDLETKKKAAPKEFQPAETKKQRQNRMKKQAASEMVKEAESQRKALQERQMHQARSFERQQAKSAAAKPPTKSAWSAPKASPQAAAPVQTAPKAAVDHGFLDTFEPTTNSSSQKPGNSDHWSNSLPSEEEQIKQLVAMTSEDEWTTVSKGKAKKKADGTTSISDSSELGETPTYVAKQKPTESVKQNGFQALNIPTKTVQGHPLDSDWAA